MFLEWIDVFMAVATGLMLRLGIPAIFTGMLIWWLRRLDIRWQAEAEQAHQILLSEVAQTPCWEIRRCSEERRAACPAYQHNELPCWQIMRRATGRMPPACLDCHVFRNAPVPVPASRAA